MRTVVVQRVVLLSVLPSTIVALHLHIIVLVFWRNEYPAVVLCLLLQNDFSVLVYWQETLADGTLQVSAVHKRVIAVHVHLVPTREHDSAVNSFRQISQTDNAVFSRRDTSVMIKRADAKARVALIAMSGLRLQSDHADFAPVAVVIWLRVWANSAN